ncbi:hypothetical protein E2C01_090388 [Portunus trituberculatus]|uniref:Uncharacterized protein n=1 Tax=Portunus trituberculatus TaxID=210409 RepID=A0A5B7JEK2_PORTR|nr:hypothetical protein [Portunus trituberculatus]
MTAKGDPPKLGERGRWEVTLTVPQEARRGAERRPPGEGGVRTRQGRRGRQDTDDPTEETRK